MPFISHENAKRLQLYSLKTGDIVFSRVGRVGSCFLATEKEEGWIISGQLLRIRISKEVIDHTYLIYSLTIPTSQKQITGTSVGSTRKSINTQILASLKIIVPPLPEQEKIAEILTSVDARLEAEKAKLAQLETLKQALMQQLLTGKIRVKI